MYFTDNPFERMMRQSPGRDSGHPCKGCRHHHECGDKLHQCRKKYRALMSSPLAAAPPKISTA